jgi:hypothetical protein
MAIKETGADQCAIDVGGLGAGVYDRVAEIVSSPEWDGPPCQIVQVNSSESPIDAKKYTNKRAEMWGETRSGSPSSRRRSRTATSCKRT